MIVAVSSETKLLRFEGPFEICKIEWCSKAVVAMVLSMQDCEIEWFHHVTVTVFVQ